MNRLLKTLLLWLLVAVLPLNAVGATLSMSCGPVHHKALEVASSHNPHHHDGADTAHDHHHDASSVAGVMSDPGAQNDASSGTHKHATCSSCAAGCIGAVAPPSCSISAAVFEGSEMITVSPSPFMAGFMLSGLERPPKRILA